MTTRLIEETHALIRPDGQIAGDGEFWVIGSREALEENLAASATYRQFLENLNGYPLRVARIRVVELLEEDAGRRERVEEQPT